MSQPASAGRNPHRWRQAQRVNFIGEGTSLAQERLRAMLTDVTQRLDEAHFNTLANLG